MDDANFTKTTKNIIFLRIYLRHNLISDRHCIWSKNNAFHCVLNESYVKGKDLESYSAFRLMESLHFWIPIGAFGTLIYVLVSTIKLLQVYGLGSGILRGHTQPSSHFFQNFDPLPQRSHFY